MQTRRSRLLDWGPCLVAAGYGAMLAWPASLPLAMRLQREGHLLEWLTVVLFVVGGVAATRAALLTAPLFVRCVFGAFAVLCFFIAGEEIAWGQQLVGTPLSAAWADANRQGETTIHNLTPFQGRDEVFYLLAAAGGLFVTRSGCASRWGHAAAPAGLRPALLLVATLAVLELILPAFVDRDPVLHHLREGVRRMKEMTELVIAWVACRYAVGGLSAARRDDRQRSAGTSCVTVAPSRTSIGSER